jgi:methionyl-tRNA formyltransferase
MDASEIRALVNATNPWNRGAIVRYRGWTFALADVSISDFQVPAGTAPGTILTLNEQEGLIISCKSEQAIRVEVFYTEEGFFTGFRLKTFGLNSGIQLIN